MKKRVKEETENYIKLMCGISTYTMAIAQALYLMFPQFNDIVVREELSNIVKIHVMQKMLKGEKVLVDTRFDQDQFTEESKGIVKKLRTLGFTPELLNSKYIIAESGNDYLIYGNDKRRQVISFDSISTKYMEKRDEAKVYRELFTDPSKLEVINSTQMQEVLFPTSEAQNNK